MNQFTKKNKKSEKLRGIYFQIGLIIAGGLTLVAFEWTSPIQISKLGGVIVEEIEWDWPAIQLVEIEKEEVKAEETAEASADEVKPEEITADEVVGEEIVAADVTDEELREFLAEARERADTAGVAETVEEVDPSDEIKRIVDSILNPEDPEADESISMPDRNSAIVIRFR